MTGAEHSELTVRPGEVLVGKYHVERVLGHGAMGVVVAARHIQLDRRVAIKFMLPAAFDDDDAVKRFEREARAAARITSEHVARVFDVDRLESGAPFIVMELLEGDDLGSLVRKGPLAIEDAIDFVLQACVAIGEAHTLGIVHRDLKPANLFCVTLSDGHKLIKVLDFGISKDKSRALGVSVTSTYAVMGTPLYMSPEQMVSAKSADAQSDIWALGVTLFELLIGRVPFDGKSASEVERKVASDPPASLRRARPEIAVELEAIVLRCLEKERAKRYANVAELARALADVAPERAKASIERIMHATKTSDIVGGRFRLEALIGSGGMGFVWRATVLETGESVALKFLKPLHALDESANKRLRREAKAAMAVRHPNVVRMDDVVTGDDGQPIIVMELLEGETLQSWLTKNAPLDVAAFAELFLPILSAVGTAHAAGVVHRDLKPENILLTTSNGETSPRVLDFGIAKIVEGPNAESAESALTTTGGMLGTPRYMAPEQVFGDKAVDLRADIWSLGVIAYECLSGKRPLPGDNVWQVLRAVTTGDIVPLQTVAPKVPATIAKIVMRMLSVDRDARPNDLVGLFDALRPYSQVKAAAFPRRSITKAEKPWKKRTFMVVATCVAAAIAIAVFPRANPTSVSTDSPIAAAFVEDAMAYASATPELVTTPPSTAAIQTTITPTARSSVARPAIVAASASAHQAASATPDRFHGLAVDAPF